MEDGIGVLEGGGLHPDAVSRLETARKLIEKRDFKKAIAQLEQAKALLIVTP